MLYTNAKLQRILIGTLSAALLLLLCFTLLPTPVQAEFQGDFYYTVNAGQATLAEYSGSAEVLSIPSTLGGYPVVAFDYGAFYGCETLTVVTIPEGVINIGDCAFCNCSNLTSIKIPGSVTRIGEGAFSGCGSLTSITIPDSVGDIGGFAFFDCSSLTSVTIPDGLKNISSSLFYGCSSLPSITIPDSVTGIGEYAFYGCSNLTSITIPDGVTAIGYCAFNGCSSLTSITIPGNVTLIDWYTFSDCGSLRNVYYGGSREQWEAITVANGNAAVTAATVHYNHIHDYTTLPPVTVTATCTEAGYIEYTCLLGESCREVLPALGHDLVLLPAFAPTCTEPGVTAGAVCQRCGFANVEQKPVAAPGHTMLDGVCAVCGAMDSIDFTGDGQLTDADAVYLLRHTLFPEVYLLSGNGDVNCDGSVTDADAVYLLRHTLFPEEYPLYPKKKDE